MKRNIFSFDKDIKSYKYPIVKIFICIILIIMFINRPNTYNKIINIVIEILCTVLGILCIKCIYISVFELFQTYDNCNKSRYASEKYIIHSKLYPIDEIVSMIQNNDIIEIQIFRNKDLFEIGSSSDCKNYDSNFFNKLYYIDNKEFLNIEDFKSALMEYSINGKISVISIDGIKVK